MRFARVVLGLALLCNVADGGEGAGGGGGAGSGAGAPPAAPPPPAQPPAPAAAAQPPAPPAPPPVDKKALAAETRAALLKEMGFADEEAFKADLKARKEAEEARKKAEDAALSEHERTKKQLLATDEARAKAEAKYEALKAELAAEKAKVAMRDKLDERGVLPTERLIVEVLHAEQAKADKVAGKDIDEEAFFAKLRKDRPYLFGSAQAGQPGQAGAQASGAAAARPATTSPAAPPPPSPFGQGPNGGQPVDALTMSDADYLIFRNTGRVPGQALGPRGNAHASCSDPRWYPGWCRQPHPAEHALA